jgi:hypothetical protein
MVEARERSFVPHVTKEAMYCILDLWITVDLCGFASAGRILSRRIGAGSQKMARGPAMRRDDEICKLMGL